MLFLLTAAANVCETRQKDELEGGQRAASFQCDKYGDDGQLLRLWVGSGAKAVTSSSTWVAQASSLAVQRRAPPSQCRVDSAINSQAPKHTTSSSTSGSRSSKRLRANATWKSVEQWTCCRSSRNGIKSQGAMLAAGHVTLQSSIQSTYLEQALQQLYCLSLPPVTVDQLLRHSCGFFSVFRGLEVAEVQQAIGTFGSKERPSQSLLESKVQDNQGRIRTCFV